MRTTVDYPNLEHPDDVLEPIRPEWGGYSTFDVESGSVTFEGEGGEPTLGSSPELESITASTVTVPAYDVAGGTVIDGVG